MSNTEIVTEFLKYASNMEISLASIQWNQDFSIRDLKPISRVRFNNLLHDFEEHMKRLTFIKESAEEVKNWSTQKKAEIKKED